jgi:hypothetical protein
MRPSPAPEQRSQQATAGGTIVGRHGASVSLFPGAGFFDTVEQSG